MKSKRILILGATGFIGFNLIKKLTQSNFEIVSFSRSKSQFSPQFVHHITGDIRDEKKIKQLLLLKPKVVVGLAGISGQLLTNQDPVLSLEINTMAYLRLLDLILKLVPGAKFIFSSSRLEYGKPQYLPVDEKHPIKPLSMYGTHKYLVTAYCEFLKKQYQLDTVVLRTSNPYGPYNDMQHNRYNIVNYFIDSARQNKQLYIYGSGNQKRDYLYIDDFISLMIKLIEANQKEELVYNVGSGIGVKFEDMAQIIIQEVGKGSIKYLPWPKSANQVETGDYISDITKVSRDFDWKPEIDFKTGIQKTLKNIC